MPEDRQGPVLCLFAISFHLLKLGTTRTAACAIELLLYTRPGRSTDTPCEDGQCRDFSLQAKVGSSRREFIKVHSVAAGSSAIRAIWTNFILMTGKASLCDPFQFLIP
jgi:hypothetical protein